MTSHSFKSSNELITKLFKNKFSSDINSPIVLKDPELQEVLMELFTHASIDYVKYGYCKNDTIIIGTFSASWASRFRLQQHDIIRQYNHYIKMLSYEIPKPETEKTLMTRCVIKVSPK